MEAQIPQPSATPYLDELKSTLMVTKTMKDLLEKRIELGMLEMKEKSGWEQNEIKISLIRTRGEIDALTKVVHEKEAYFEKYAMQYAKDAQEMREKLDSILVKAKSMASSNEAIKFILDRDWAAINIKEEFKVAFYKRLKAAIETSK